MNEQSNFPISDRATFKPGWGGANERRMRKDINIKEIFNDY